MGYCYRYVTIEGKGVKPESYALIDPSSPLNALSDEFAKSAKLSYLGGAKARAPLGEAMGWRTKAPVAFNRTDVKIAEVEFVVLAKRLLEDDVLLGEAVVDAVGAEKLLSIRYKCDKCREGLTACDHRKRRVEPIA
jgi:hypothetical protein